MSEPIIGIFELSNAMSEIKCDAWMNCVGQGVLPFMLTDKFGLLECPGVPVMLSSEMKGTFFWEPWNQRGQTNVGIE